MKPIWTPTKAFADRSNLSHYIEWLHQNHGMSFGEYEQLWAWSVKHPAMFWETIWAYFNVQSHSPYERVMSGGSMPGVEWFKGATLNYAEHVFNKRPRTGPAILHQNEHSGLQSVSWDELETRVASMQAFLKSKGVSRGDRVSAYLPNIPEASVAMLATLSIGAIWSSCSPDFGLASVIDRFKQIAPKVLIVVDGYHYGGKTFDRIENDKLLVETMGSIEQVVLIPFADPETKATVLPKCTLWAEVMACRGGELQFEALPFGHPIWILYSSGTTGIPKAITHSHGGVLLEHLKFLSFHNNVKAGERFFWFTTTGWMMWNYTHAALLLGATIVLYDGSPGYPNMDVLWKLAEEAKITHFGTSAPFLISNMKAGMSPMGRFDFRSMHSLSATGSPMPHESFVYVEEHIKKNIWVVSMSGGTDVCSGFVGGNPMLPVYEGEIQCRGLGCDMHALDDRGNPMIGEVGEMVIRTPMPSMPIFFWNDPTGEKYKSSYFEMYEGMWRHGDWLKITERGTLLIYGRSDATLNRQGVRIGTAEIYRAMDKIKEIKDSLIINLEQANGEHYMPLFVMLGEGVVLDEALKTKIKQTLKTECSPRHIPDDIIAVPDIPYTISGKKMEAPIKKIMSGIVLEKAVTIGSVRNPGSLDFFVRHYKNTHA